jgi:hypothetical protein
MTSTNTESISTEDFNTELDNLGNDFHWKRKTTIVRFLASTSEADQLAIVASPHAPDLVVEALAHSSHESVLKAIVERGAHGNHVAAVCTVAFNTKGRQASQDAKALVEKVMRENPVSVAENLNHFINHQVF